MSAEQQTQSNQEKFILRPTSRWACIGLIQEFVAWENLGKIKYSRLLFIEKPGCFSASVTSVAALVTDSLLGQAGQQHWVSWELKCCVRMAA